jgi:hypothetical protein
MNCDNSKKIEREFHNKYNEFKLKIMIKKQNHFYQPNELYNASDEIKNKFLIFSTNKNLEPLYNIFEHDEEYEEYEDEDEDEVVDWFDIIPNEIQDTLKEMFQEKELLMLVKNEDDLTKDELKHLRENY